MVKINGNEAIISRAELMVLIGAAMASTLDSYDMTKKLETLIMECAAVTNNAIEEHIWGKKKIPGDTLELAKRITRIYEEVPEPSQDQKPAGEDKQAICRLLLAALQKTRAYHDLTDLMYDPNSGKVLAKYAGRSALLINTECDSGIAMVNDILAHI